MGISLRVLAPPPVNKAERGEVVWKAPVNVKVISMDIWYQCSNEGLVSSEVKIKFRRELLSKLLSFANLSVKSD